MMEARRQCSSSDASGRNGHTASKRVRLAEGGDHMDVYVYVDVQAMSRSRLGKRMVGWDAERRRVDVESGRSEYVRSMYITLVAERVSGRCDGLGQS